MKKKLLLICLCSLCIAVGTQIDITKVKADIVSDGGSDSIGGETAGDNDGVIVGDGDQQPDPQPAPQPVPVQPPQEAETPAASQPVKSSQSKKEPEKTIEPQKTENPDSPEELEKSAEPAPSKEPEKTEKPAPSKEPEKIENPAPSEKAEDTQTVDTADQKEMQKPAETIPSKEKTPAISLKIIKMFGALIIGYIVAAVIVLGLRTVMSPLVFYMSIDMRYRFAAPVRLKKASEGYQIDITKIIDRYDSSTFQIRFNRMVLKKLQGMELTIINGVQRIASDIRSSIDISI